MKHFATYLPSTQIYHGLETTRKRRTAESESEKSDLLPSIFVPYKESQASVNRDINNNTQTIKKNRMRIKICIRWR